MELLFLFFFFAFLIYLDIGGYSSLLKVGEEDIERNLKQLKRYNWFQDYLNDQKYRDLIVHDQDVRKSIGKLNSSKLNRDAYLAKRQKKLEKVLYQKSYSLD